MIRRLSLSEVAGIIDNNGLGEAFLYRIDADEIEDTELQLLWRQIQILMELVKLIINEVPFED